MHFWWMVPYVVIFILILYSIFSPIIDWIIFDTDWSVWGPIDLGLYFVWWITGARRTFWNRMWNFWFF